ncbi:hypothetical protein ACVIGB_000808 [Bradyrhizobium sp. USDA 4341]
MRQDALMPTDAVQARLSLAIRSTLQQWLSVGSALDGQQINSGAARGGCCSDFASEVLKELGGVLVADRLGIETLDIGNFQVSDDDDVDGRPLDRELLRRHWPKVIPPGELDWGDLDRLSEDAGFSGGTHVWLALNGRHYDAEAPEGVENFLELPFFQRVVASWIAERGWTPHA